MADGGKQSKGRLVEQKCFETNMKVSFFQICPSLLDPF